MRTAWLLLVALVCLVWAGTGVPAWAETLWMVYTPISPVEIITPTPMVRGAGVNEEVQFVCSECDDYDCVCEGIFGGWVVQDDVTYTWSATGGTFPQGQTGTSVLWKAPPVAGDYTVTVTVNDVDGHKWPEYLMTVA